MLAFANFPSGLFHESGAALFFWLLARFSNFVLCLR